MSSTRGREHAPFNLLRRLGLAATLVFVVASAAVAQQPPKTEAEQKIIEGREARQKGQLDPARAAFTAAATLSDHATGWQAGLAAVALGNLAALERADGHAPESAAAFDRAKAAIDPYPGATPDGSAGAHYLTIVNALYDIAHQLRTANAIPEARYLLEQALRIDEAVFGPDHPSVSRSLRELAIFLIGQHDDAGAEPLIKRALAIREKTFGPDDVENADSLFGLAMIAVRAQHDADAEPLFMKALAIREKAIGPDNPLVADILDRLAVVERTLRKPDQAEALTRRAIDIREKTAGADSPVLGIELERLGSILLQAKREAEAEGYLQRAIALREKNNSGNDAAAAFALETLAIIERNLGHLGDAEPLMKRALALRETLSGVDHPFVAIDLVTLSTIYFRARRYDDAIPVLDRAIAIREKAFGPESPTLPEALEDLAASYRLQSKLGQAEPLLKRAIAIREKSTGPDDPAVAGDIDVLANLYRNLQRYGEAEMLDKRTMAMTVAKFGADSPVLARRMSDLGTVYIDAGRNLDSQSILKQSMAIFDKAGLEDASVASALLVLGLADLRLGQYPDADIALSRCLAIRERLFGRDHASLTLVLARLVELYSRQGRFADAEAAGTRSLAIAERTMGTDDPIVALALEDLAEVKRKLNKPDEAIDEARRAVAIRVRRIERGLNDRLGEGVSEQHTGHFTFVELLELLADRPDAGSPEIVNEAFVASQYAGGTETAQALANMAARYATGSDALGQLARRRQDLEREWQTLDAELIKAISQPKSDRDFTAESIMRTRIADLRLQVDQADAQLRTDFPKFAELTSVRPVSVADVQTVIAPGEALVVWTVGRNETLVFVITRDRATFFGAPLAPAALLQSVRALRNSLDRRNRSFVEMPPFNTQIASNLYQALLGPAEPLLRNISSLAIVASGALQSLPPAVLVTVPPVAPVRTFTDYASVPWLLRRYSITMLPAVSSLIALRDLPAANRARDPFIGFGDPTFAPEKIVVAKAEEVEVQSLFRGASANVPGLRRLPPLPETADELRAEAKILDAPASSVHLGDDATVSHVKALDLSSARIVAFATHGLVAGELPNLAEPALVMTPPQTPTTEDDGLLRASQVSRLKLNADWVVLSACNTAAADGTPGAEGLSGLARAFFYAGARSVLVSHWPVNSETTVLLTTGAFQAMEKDGAGGRAEALRRSMVAMIDGAGKGGEPDYFAHPLFWAPFVLVGEGGAGR